MAELENSPERSASSSERERASDESLRFARIEPLLYLLFAGACTLFVACRFYASLKLQTLHAYAWARPDVYPTLVKERVLGTWSAPLDDVFIHFDFARETARGRPFQWSEGAGYSSGGTSLLYPFVLALGYLLGFRKLDLMAWAAIVACVSVFALLIAARRLCAGLPRAAHFLLPPCVLCVGALDWSLFSGMEVALFLALWGGAVIAWDDLSKLALKPAASLGAPAALLGAWGASIVATRPEGGAALFVLVASAIWYARKRSPREVLTLLVLSFAPALGVLLAHGVANRILTGESTAAGALVKLEMNHPFFTPKAVIDAWLFHLKYQVLRVTQYHFADSPVYGWLAWLLAAVPLFFASTRRAALVLWASVISWMMIVALNGQVRWQNERYTMPAVAWLLLAAALGLAVLLTEAIRSRANTRKAWLPALAAAAMLAAGCFSYHQAPRFREQLWFFGRASRNILDQHLTAGALIRHDAVLKSKRVLVGDAGAIPYASDVPALDVIGLGGFRGLPFARATRTNIAAAIELIERIPAADRPDLLAIYPGWWSDFPLWFGTRVGEVPVRGNVICGGASKVLYRPRWEPLEHSAVPYTLGPGERVLDSLDQADLVSEKEHRYALSEKHIGFVFMKLLPYPVHPTEDLWDAARIVPPGVSETFRLRNLNPHRPLVLVLRSAPTAKAEFDVRSDGKTLGHVRLIPRDGWVETRVTLPPPGAAEVTLEFGPSASERALFQVWAVAAP
ncbi:MAG TPA: hypothetical protein VFK05_14500 [Polyangiaceae bacterium]|nr:hypothetical protein [Polyangiaceae bacterium]